MNENDKIVEINRSNNNNATEPIAGIDVCAETPTMPEDPQYAYAYIKFQNTAELYSPENALCAGTVFPVLNMPYCGWDSRIVK